MIFVLRITITLLAILFLFGCGREVVEQPSEETQSSRSTNATSQSSDTPFLKLSTYVLTFAPGETEKTFTITNVGGGILEGTITSYPSGIIFDHLPAVVVTPFTFSLKAGESITVKAKVGVRKSGSLIIETNIGREVISVVVE